MLGRAPIGGARTASKAGLTSNNDSVWRCYFEYFNGDDGAGLGVSHQTGWTTLVADVIRRRHGTLPFFGEIIARCMRDDDPT